MKPILSILFIVSLSVAVTACRSTHQLPNQLRSDMSRAEVIAIMGTPETSMSPGAGIEILKYTLKKQRAYVLKVPLTTPYLVRLVDGRVDSYGTAKELKSVNVNLNIRTATTNAVPVTPVQPNANIKAD